MTDIETVFDRMRQWAARARSAQVALDVEGSDRKIVALQAGQLLDLAEDIERTADGAKKGSEGTEDQANEDDGPLPMDDEDLALLDADYTHGLREGTRRSVAVVRDLAANLHPEMERGLAAVIHKALGHAAKKIEQAGASVPKKFCVIHPSDRILCTWNDSEQWSADPLDPVLFLTADEAQKHVDFRRAQYPHGDWPEARVGEFTPGVARVHPTWKALA